MQLLLKVRGLASISEPKVENLKGISFGGTVKFHNINQITHTHIVKVDINLKENLLNLRMKCVILLLKSFNKNGVQTK